MNQVSNKRFNLLKKAFLFFLMVALILPVFPDTVLAAKKSTLKITDLKTAKSAITMGQGCSITGKITSNYKITKVTGYIERDKDFEGQYEVVGKSYSYNPNAKSVTLKNSKLDKNLKFGDKAPGKYRVRVVATDSSGKKVTAISPVMYIQGLKIEAKLATTSIKYKSACNLTGTIRTDNRIEKAYAVIYKGKSESKNNVVKQSKTYSTIYRHLDIGATINYDLKFGELAKGTYTLVIYAEDEVMVPVVKQKIVFKVV